MTARANRRVPPSVTVSKKSRKQRLGLTAQKAGPGRRCAFRHGVDPGVLQDLPHRGGATLTPRTRVRRAPADNPRRVLPGQTQYQQPNRAHRPGRPGRPGRDWPRGGRPRSRCHRRTVSGHTSSRSRLSTPRGNQCSNAARNARSHVEPKPAPAQLPFQHTDLVPQREDLHVLLPSLSASSRKTRTHSSPPDRSVGEHSRSSWPAAGRTSGKKPTRCRNQSIATPADDSSHLGG